MNRKMLLGAMVAVFAGTGATAEAPIVAPPPIPGAPPVLAREWCPAGRIPGVDVQCNLSRPSPRGTRQVDVVLRVGSDIVWKGALSFANYNGASISQNRSESFACQPISPETRSAQQLNTSFSIRLGGYQDGVRVPVSVEVTRPFEETQKGVTPCLPRGLGTKTVRFDTQAELVDGKPVTLSGDGGVSIILSSR